MITKEESKALWAKAQKSVRALDACTGPHDFTDLDPARVIGKRFRCTKCGGEIDGVEKRYYDQGLKHGRASPVAAVEVRGPGGDSHGVDDHCA